MRNLPSPATTSGRHAPASVLLALVHSWLLPSPFANIQAQRLPAHTRLLGNALVARMLVFAESYVSPRTGKMIILPKYRNRYTSNLAQFFVKIPGNGGVS